MGEFRKVSRDRIYTKKAEFFSQKHFLLLRRKKKSAPCSRLLFVNFRARERGAKEREKERSAGSEQQKKGRFSFATFSRTRLIREEVFLSFACSQKRTTRARSRAQRDESSFSFFFLLFVPFSKAKELPSLGAKTLIFFGIFFFWKSKGGKLLRESAEDTDKTHTYTHGE